LAVTRTVRRRNPRKGEHMTKDEVLQMCLEYIETNAHERRHVRWAIKVALAEPDERNFCPRCGKRTADLTTIHTCTPPQEKDV
jgi:hypothetical protein